MQRACVIMPSAQISIELPPVDAEVIPGVCWGAVEAFPTPAYWAYQVIARRISSKSVQYKLGASLREEVGACLLGGHGIPASIGLLAFNHLKSKGAFEPQPPSEHDLLQWLSEPMQAKGKQVRYRFVAQKARYLAAALQKLSSEAAPSTSSRALRDWLTLIPGVGYKTASWVVRNWMVASDGTHHDGTKGFIEKLDALMACQEGGLRVRAPAIGLSTVELVRTSGIPMSVLAWAHSCHKANVPCGQCRGCNKYLQTIHALSNESSMA